MARSLTHKQKLEMGKYLDPRFPERYTAPFFRHGDRVRLIDDERTLNGKAGTVIRCTQRSHFLKRDTVQLPAGFRIRGVYEVRLDKAVTICDYTTRIVYVNDDDMKGGSR